MYLKNVRWIKKGWLWKLIACSRKWKSFRIEQVWTEGRIKSTTTQCYHIAVYFTPIIFNTYRGSSHFDFYTFVERIRFCSNNEIQREGIHRNQQYLFFPNTSPWSGERNSRSLFHPHCPATPYNPYQFQTLLIPPQLNETSIEHYALNILKQNPSSHPCPRRIPKKKKTKILSCTSPTVRTTKPKFPRMKTRTRRLAFRRA